jgi:hypothetical protein
MNAHHTELLNLHLTCLRAALSTSIWGYFVCPASPAFGQVESPGGITGGHLTQTLRLFAHKQKLWDAERAMIFIVRGVCADNHSNAVRLMYWGPA